MSRPEGQKGGGQPGREGSCGAVRHRVARASCMEHVLCPLLCMGSPAAAAAAAAALGYRAAARAR